MQKNTYLKWTLIITVFAVAATAWSNHSFVASATTMASDGGAIYAAKCAKCHGADGKGIAKYQKKGQKDFTDKAWQKSKSDARLNASSTNGKGEAMPAWKGKLTPEDIKALVGYVRTFGK